MADTTQTYKSVTALFLILAGIVIVYSNTFDAAWHLDDYPNIVHNPEIHLNDLYPFSLARTLSASPHEPDGGGEGLYRPVAMLSFAINWYVGKDNVFGFHLVNLAVHGMTAVLLFFTVQLLLQTPKAGVRDADIRRQAALLAAFIWAVHPVQIQAVTYIVQRMASLAGMFYILGLYAYLKARLARAPIIKILGALGCAGAFLLALGSKENSFLMPFSIALIEVVFFHTVNRQFILRRKTLLITALGLAACIGLALVMVDGDLAGVFRSYRDRSFTPVQRLLTEARVLFAYLYQLVYPVPGQFSIDHGVIPSKGLFDPWPTAVCMGGIGALIVTSLALLPQYPLAGFALLFFFLNHSLESTILNLELMFEHRNYIPSFFCFVPFAQAVTRYLNQNRDNPRKKGRVAALIMFCVLFICLAGVSTHARNKDWKSAKKLWESAIAVAPGNARPYQNLASYHYIMTKEWDMAIALMETALPLRDNKPVHAKMISYDNLRYCHMMKGDAAQAVAFGKKAVQARPARIVISGYIQTLAMANKPDTVLDVMNRFYPDNKGAAPHDLQMKTRAHLKMRQGAAAYAAALDGIQKAPFDPVSIQNFGFAHLFLHHFARAERYLQKALVSGASDPAFILIALIQNSINRKDPVRAEFYARKLVSDHSLKDAFRVLRQQSRGPYPLVPLDRERIALDITAAAYAISEKALEDRP